MRISILCCLVSVFMLPASAQNCPTYQGLKHCPIGTSVLSISNGFLYATNSAPGDGVSIQLPQTTSWSGSLALGNTRKTARVEQAAISNGFVVSTQTLHINQTGLKFEASFTGQTESTYSVIIRDAQGTLVGAAGGLTSLSQVIATPGDLDWPPWTTGPTFPWPPDDWPDPPWDDDFKRLATGACTWIMSFGGTLNFNVGGNTYTGTSIQMLEEVAPGQQYPYLSFDEITIRSNTDSIVISGETFE